MAEKSEVRSILSNFCKMVKTQFHTKIKHVRSDNGGEYICLKIFLPLIGISHETTIPYTPQQNGRIECKQ